MTEANQRKSGAVLSYVSIIVSTLVQLLYTPLLIRMLGKSEYGLYSLISSIIGYLTVLDLGFGNAIIVYTAKYRAQNKVEEEKKLHGMFFVVFCIIGAIAALLGLLLFYNVDNIFGNTMTVLELQKAKIMMLILSFNLAINFPFSIYSAIISAYERFTYQKIISILNTIMKPLIMLPLLFLGFKSVAMTVVITIINILVLLSNYFFCRNKLKVNVKFNGFDKLLFKEIFTYSFFIFLGVLVDKANWSVDNFILGMYCGTVAVSIYAIAASLHTLFVNLSSAVSSVLLPKMSKMVANNATREQLTNEFIKVGRIQYYVVFLMASGLVLFGKNFINLWAGEGFEDSYYIALILIIPLCFPLIQNLGLSIMQAMNKHKFRAVATIVMAVFNVIISVFLAQKYQAIGAAIGTAVSLIICNIFIMNIYYYKVIKIDVIKFWKNILFMTIKFVIPICIILLIMNCIKLNGWMAFIVYGSIYTFLYAITSYKLCVNEYERSIIDKVLIKIHKKNK